MANRPPELVQEGWLLKRSRTLHVWRRRWASLWDEERTAANGNGPRVTSASRLLFSPEKQHYNDTSEVFELSQVLGVCEANLDSSRAHCFVLQYQEKSQVRTVGLQAADEASLNGWLSALLSRAQARPCRGELPTLLESSPIATGPVPAQPSGAKPSTSEAATPQGKGSKGPPKPAKGKGKTKGPGPPKGKGKGPPLPPPEAGKGKGKTPAAKPPLLFGKRLNLRDSGALPETARGERPQENIFQGLLRERAGRTQEDIDTLHSFFQPKTSERSERTPSSGRPLTPGTQGTPRAVFDDKVARNCAIVMKALPLKGLDLVKAVELLEPGPLDQDQLERLATVMPKEAQMAQLKLASSQTSLVPLRDVEQALVPFAHLGRLQERLKALTLAANLVVSEQSFLAQLRKVSGACREICDSHSLKNVLATVLVMYNYVNFGQVNRTDARAFDIANLLQLSEFRSDRGGPFPRFTALHYVAMRLFSENPQSARSLQEELSQVQEAAGVCLCSVEVYIKELRTDIQKLLEEQKANAKVYGGQEQTPAPAPATPQPRRGSMLSEVTECTDDEHITPRTSRIELPVQTPRCASRMAGWIRAQLGAAKPLELGELARGMPQQCLDPDELQLIFEGKAPVKASVSISNLGLLYIRELQDPSAASTMVVKAIPIIGSELSLVSSPTFGQAIFEMTYSATPRVRRRLVFQANELRALEAACRWQRALKQAANGDGAGWLKVQTSLGFFRWNWATLLTVPLGRVSEFSLGSLTLCPGSRWLVWFKTPEDLLHGNVLGGVELAGTEVFSTDPRRFTFAVAHVKRDRSTGREQMKQLVLRSGTEDEMKRWMTALRRPPEEPRPSLSRAVSGESSFHSEGSSARTGGRQRISVPRLNLGKAETSSASARSKSSTTSTEYSSPLKQPTGKAKNKDTLWTEIHRDIITPRPDMAQNAPRLVDSVDRCVDDDSSSEDSEDESSSESTASTVSEGSRPPAAATAAPLSRRGPEPLTARGISDAEVTTFSRMSALAEEAEASADLLTRNLSESLEEGKRLLLFLGQKPPAETADLAVKVRSVFDTISKFVGQFKGAAAEVEKFQKKNNGGATTFSGENLGFYRRRKAEAAPKAAAAATPAPPNAQCKRLARDCVLHALFRACHPDASAPARCWERRVGALRSPGRPPLLPSPSRPAAPALAKLSTLEELD